MDDKEQFDALVELSKSWIERMRERTNREVQFSLAVWAILAAAIAYPHPTLPPVILAATLVALVLVYILFVIEVWARNRFDGSRSRFFSAHAEKLIFPETKLEPRPNYFESMSLSTRPWPDLIGRDFWWSGMEILITVTLAFWLYLLTAASSPQPTIPWTLGP